MGVVIGAPIMAIITARLPRKTTLIGLASTFVIGNLLCALAPGYATLMAARVFTAFCHGASSASARWWPPTWCRATSAPAPSR